jgi:hypothetical protein
VKWKVDGGDEEWQFRDDIGEMESRSLKSSSLHLPAKFRDDIGEMES